MGNSYLDQEKAIREVGRGFDILKQLQGLLQLKPRTGDGAVHTYELAEPLFREALQSLHHALSIMKSGVSNKIEIKSEIAVLESGSPVNNSTHGMVVSYDSSHRIENGRGKRKRAEENSWINNTSMPYDDGYQWRKYGDKKITGSNFTRSYFRCTYKEEQGCEAKKIVQEIISDIDTRLFKVTYTNKHTCNFYKTTSASSSRQPSPFRSIEQDISINQMSHSMPQLLEQASCFDANNLRDMFPFATHMVERNCEWDMDSLLMDLVGCPSGYILS